LRRKDLRFAACRGPSKVHDRGQGQLILDEWLGDDELIREQPSTDAFLTGHCSGSTDDDDNAETPQ